jgi:hypothetical protein
MIIDFPIHFVPFDDSPSFREEYGLIALLTFLVIKPEIPAFLFSGSFRTPITRAEGIKEARDLVNESLATSKWEGSSRSHTTWTEEIFHSKKEGK